MLKPIHNPSSGKLRVIGYASGSGNTLWKAYEMQKEMEKTADGCPFEIVGVFSDNPESGSIRTAKELGLAHVSINLREYYKEKGKPLKDREVRAEYDAAALDLLRPLQADAIMLAGYVWATTDQLLDEYLIINVHPADLSIRKDGRRAFAGANGIVDALNAGEKQLCSTAHIATKVLDNGPILVISQPVPVDYSLHDDDTARAKHYLKLVNDQSRLVGARALLEVASGAFCEDDQKNLYYKGTLAPNGIRIESWDVNKPDYQRNVNKLLNPESIAVIGASNKPGIGRSIMNNLVQGGFKGRLYAVNRRAEDVLGAKGCLSVLDIQESVDMAVIATPSASVLALAEECGKKAVQALVCITAGFKEVGGEGIKAQEELVKIVDRYNMKMVGPNCMGLMNAGGNMNATILSGDVVKGNVALVTQSGAIGAALLDYAEKLSIGFSSIVSLGNQADVTVCDLLPIYERDENTKVILLYLESILEPERFCRLAQSVTKPILLLKAGSTDAGMAAASSHTGSLAGNDKVVDAIIKKTGITRVYSLEECFLCASALANMPQAKGERVGLLTNAGGPGILISDALSKCGFTLPRPSEALRSFLSERLMAEASVNNPIDLVATAPPEHYVTAVRAMIDSGEFDALLICCVPPATVDTEAVAQALIPELEGSSIPVLTEFFGPTLGAGARLALRANKIPTCEYPEQMAAMLNGMRVKEKMPQLGRVSAPARAVNAARAIMEESAAGEYLSTDKAYELLDMFGITAAKNVLLKSAAEAETVSLVFPVVAKIDHPEIVHKSDVGGVKLNISSKQELAATVGEFISKFKGANGVFVQEQVPAGIELIVGSTLDPQLGPSVMVGLGGVWVEIMKDVAFGYLPVGESEAMAMIDSLACEPLLAGYRGKPGVNKSSQIGRAHV